MHPCFSDPGGVEQHWNFAQQNYVRPRWGQARSVFPCQFLNRILGLTRLSIKILYIH